jgi:uncharacterized protein YuzE
LIAEFGENRKFAKVTYDPEAKAMYISLKKGGQVATSKAFGWRIYMDTDVYGNTGFDLLFKDKLSADIKTNTFH